VSCSSMSQLCALASKMVKPMLALRKASRASCAGLLSSVVWRMRRAGGIEKNGSSRQRQQRAAS